MNITTRERKRARKKGGKVQVRTANTHHLTRLIVLSNEMKSFKKVDIANYVGIRGCYMNSALQFLLHHKIFIKKITSNDGTRYSLNPLFRRITQN